MRAPVPGPVVAAANNQDALLNQEPNQVDAPLNEEPYQADAPLNKNNHEIDQTIGHEQERDLINQFFLSRGFFPDGSFQCPHCGMPRDIEDLLTHLVFGSQSGDSHCHHGSAWIVLYLVANWTSQLIHILSGTTNIQANASAG